jgi:hypothetical protein
MNALHQISVVDVLPTSVVPIVLQQPELQLAIPVVEPSPQEGAPLNVELSSIQSSLKSLIHLSRATPSLSSGPHCSIKLKVKDLIVCFSKVSKLVKGNPLVTQLPYFRLTESEIADLFRSYRVSLSSIMTQCDEVIQQFRTMQRDKFSKIIEQILMHTKEDTFELTTSTHVHPNNPFFSKR